MPVSKAEKKKRRLKAKRKAADDHQSSTRRMKRRLNDHPGVGEKEHQGAGAQLGEALFKIRHAAEFDDKSVTDIGGQKNVKQEEQQLDNGNAAEASQSAIYMTGSRTNHGTSLPRPATKPDSAFTDRVDQEDILVTILSQTTWDTKMTQATVKSLAERAQQKASPGNLSDATYIDGLLTRLDMSGIQTGRRTEIVAMLQGALHELLGRWKTCIRRVGDTENFTSPNVDARAKSQGFTGPDHGLVPGSSRLMYVDARRRDEGEAARSLSTACSRLAQHLDQTTMKPTAMRLEARMTKTRVGKARPPRTVSSSHEVIHHCCRRQAHQRWPTRQSPRTTYDSTGLSALKRHLTSLQNVSFQPGPWHRSLQMDLKKVVGRHSERRAGWQKLYEARHDPDIDVSALGHRLFLSQDLLQHVIPRERLQVVGTRLQVSLVGIRRPDVPEPPSQSISGQLPNPGSEDTNDATAGAHRNMEHNNQVVARQARVEFRQSNLQVPITFASWEAARLFPRLVQATSTLPSTQPCFVPASTREHDSNGCLFIMNTPESIAGRVITAPDVRIACTQALFEGFKDVIRHNYNMFVAYFDTRRKARQAGHVWALNFPVTSPTLNRQMPRH